MDDFYWKSISSLLQGGLSIVNICILVPGGLEGVLSKTFLFSGYGKKRTFLTSKPKLVVLAISPH